MRLDIELTDQEALAVFCALCAVGGNPAGPRGAVDKVRRALGQIENLPPQTLRHSATRGEVYMTDDTWREFATRMHHVVSQPEDYPPAKVVADA